MSARTLDAAGDDGAATPTAKARRSRTRHSLTLRLRDIVGRSNLRALEEQLGPGYGPRDAETYTWTALFVVLMVATYVLGRYFPPLTAFLSGAQLYTPANFKYAPNVKFDDTWLTYGTDYGLAVVMGFFAWAMATEKKTTRSTRLAETGSALLASYSVSTLAGALAHQFLPGKLHTALFRLIWKICVGAVGAAGGMMGATASALADLPHDPARPPRFRVPVVPDFCWTLWSLFFLGVIFTNRFSMTQPACDIFLTGVTQTPSTIYLVLVLVSRSSWANVNVTMPVVAIIIYGALANIALLPTYDVLNYAQFPLGVTNAIMHAWLCLAWGSQGYGLWQFVKGTSSALDD